MTNHFIVQCEKCKDIISQCRCPDLNKTITWIVCKKCKTSKIAPVINDDGTIKHI